MKSTLEARHDELYLDCVHCGLCLSSCPTYRVLGNEMDSPRGRIYLMRALDEGRTSITDTFVDHMFRCLDCRACETVCPSGVRFGHMMEDTRARIVNERSTNWIMRLTLNHIFPHPGRFHLAARLLQIYNQSGLSGFLRSTGLLERFAPDYAAAEEMMPDIAPGSGVVPGNVYSAVGRPRGRVAFFAGCVMNSVLGELNRASVGLLTRAGYDVVVPDGQVCCGALANHAGLRDTARGMARSNLPAFRLEGVEAIIVNASGCGAMLSEYPLLVEGAEAFSLKVRDLASFLGTTSIADHFTERMELRVGYDDPCQPHPRPGREQTATGSDPGYSRRRVRRGRWGRPVLRQRRSLQPDREGTVDGDPGPQDGTDSGGGSGRTRDREPRLLVSIPIRCAKARNEARSGSSCRAVDPVPGRPKNFDSLTKRPGRIQFQYESRSTASPRRVMNTAKTAALLAGMTVLLVFAGGALGGGGGMVIAFIFALVMNAFSYWFSDKIILKMYKAREASEQDAPVLYGVVRDLTMRANMPMPKVYVIPGDAPNAFATGRNPNHAAVAATHGILRLLSREELAGVMAHELAHVQNRDILIGTIAATIAGAISMLATMAQWAMIFGGGRRDDDDGGIIGLIAMMILAPFGAALIQMAISRSREYQADATGARLCGNPMWLAEALRKLDAQSRRIPMNASPATAHMFIVNPLRSGVMAKLFSTHPPMTERVSRLEKMAYGSIE